MVYFNISRVQTKYSWRCTSYWILRVWVRLTRINRIQTPSESAYWTVDIKDIYLGCSDVFTCDERFLASAQVVFLGYVNSTREGARSAYDIYVTVNTLTNFPGHIVDLSCRSLLGSNTLLWNAYFVYWHETDDGDSIFRWVNVNKSNVFYRTSISVQSAFTFSRSPLLNSSHINVSFQYLLRRQSQVSWWLYYILYSCHSVWSSASLTWVLRQWWPAVSIWCNAYSDSFLDGYNEQTYIFLFCSRHFNDRVV